MGRASFLLLIAAALVIAAVGFRQLGRLLGDPRAESPGRHSIPCQPPLEAHAEYMARSRAKNVVADAVLAGRLSLIDAAAAFHRIDGEKVPQIVAMIPGRSLKEKLCREVIFYVSVNEYTTSGSDDVTRRLEEELECRLAAGEFGPEAVAE
ncbi:MAG TPA: hypothetical protein VKE74_27150 [Gemmataceae bacterium]|nr:hypothetical protein [Gemmataceae bacterium]